MGLPDFTTLRASRRFKALARFRLKGGVPENYLNEKEKTL